MRRWSGLGLVLAVTALAACDVDSFFEVRNPGRILDEDLNTALGIRALAVGASSELSDWVDQRAFLVGRASDELAGSGSYFSTGLFRRGYLLEDDVGFYWSQPHESRWAAEELLRRMTEILGEAEAMQDTIYARAHVLSGIGHLALGQNFCEVIYERSANLARDTAFARARNMFAGGEAAASSLGATNLLVAARMGQAEALAGLAFAGRATWAEVQAMADQVPTDFKYYAFYDINDQWNVWYSETHGRHEASAYGTIVAALPEDNPRAPYTDCTVQGACDNAVGADGVTPHYRQEKFPERGSDMPVLNGVRARMLEAEAYLHMNDMGNFINEINEARAYFDPSGAVLPALAAPADQQEAFAILEDETLLNNWLEGLRLWDLDRWDKDGASYTLYPGSRTHDFVNGGTIVWETDLAKRSTCMPIPLEECEVNPNATCTG